MDNQNIGTLNGEPITQEMLDSFTATFERDWALSEVEVVPTERGKALRALLDLSIPLNEIEALENRAKQKKQTLGMFIHSILQNELIVFND